MRRIKIAALVVPSLIAIGWFALAFAPDAGAGGPAATASDGIWVTIEEPSAASADPQVSASDAQHVLRLNKEALTQLLARAPMERTGDLRQSRAVLALPMPDGSFQRFHIEESPVVDAALVIQYPQIKSYRGQGIDDATATARFDWTPLGFHALVLSADRSAVNIQPAGSNDLTAYASSYDKRVPFKCGVDESDQVPLGAAGTTGPNGSVGSTLRTERIAIAATWEFCNGVGGNTLAGTIAAINSYLNATNAIYERELSIHLNLVNAPNIIYASNNSVCGPGNNTACNSGNDPYTNSNPSTMLDEVQADLDAKVGSANYDVGHVLATGTGGVATTGVVCGAFKGRGASAVFPPAGISGAIGLFAHELGHQHGARHSFNGMTSNCDGNRNNQTSWEPGSGTTLMSYAGLCGSDNVANLVELRFHNGSFNQIVAYLTGVGSCGAISATGNNVPTVDAGPPRTIPKLTPFTLTAGGTDADPADVPNLTFIWEQIDAGEFFYFNPPYGDQPGDPSTTTRPLFRSFSPTTDRSRTFPSLTYILNNANVPPATVNGFQTAESLPAVARTMNFRATVRDNRSGFGSVNDSSVAITVDGNSGPFALTAPNGGGTLGGAQTVTWNVNNTNAAPVSCANVAITLSTDGGLTFPFTLAASTPNDGSQIITLPNGILSSTCRIKVEAVGNVFFDISDGNFSVAPGDTCPAISGLSPLAGNPGSSVTITGINFMNGGNVTGVKFANNVTASFNVVNDTTITATVPAGAVAGAITVSKAGCADVQTPGFSLCPNAPVALAVDDGGIEFSTTIGNNGYYVNRLTPPGYPATLSQISIFWEPNQNFPQGSSINVVSALNPSGSANIDGISFQSFAATAGAQPGFSTYTLPVPITINAGDFVVGFQVQNSPGGTFPGAVDNSSPSNRSYRSSGGATFIALAGGDLMIRATVFINCAAPPPSPTPTPAPTPTPVPTPTPTPTATATPAPGLVGNVSTRLPVGTGDNVLIEGFIVQGPVGSTKKIMVRAIGPSLIPFGIADAVADPTLEIRDPAGALLASNNDWGTTVVGGLITGDQTAEINGSGLAPSNGLESAIIANLVPGSYTAVVRGLNNTTGTGVVDAYDLSAASPAKLANISTRGLVQPGDRLMIAGFIIQNGPVRAVVRAIGPSLVAFGIPNALPNTTLQLRDQNGAIVRENDDWRTDQQAELLATGLQPTDDLEAALVQVLPPGQYTAQVRGNPESTGIGVVQVYFID